MRGLFTDVVTDTNRSNSSMLTKESDPEPQPGTSVQTNEDSAPSQEHSEHEENSLNNEELCPYFQSLMKTALMHSGNLNTIFRLLNSNDFNNAARFIFLILMTKKVQIS